MSIVICGGCGVLVEPLRHRCSASVTAIAPVVSPAAPSRAAILLARRRLADRERAKRFRARKRQAALSVEQPSVEGG